MIHNLTMLGYIKNNYIDFPAHLTNVCYHHTKKNQSQLLWKIFMKPSASVLIIYVYSFIHCNF